MGNYCFSITGRISYRILFLGIAVVVNGSCSDVIQENITNETVQVIIPQPNSSVTTNNVHFKWNELQGADSYRLQLVEPSFTNLGTFHLDSLIPEKEYYYALSPGDYEFMIRGENSVYQSVYAGPYAFTVDSVSDLTSQIVPLLAPLDGYYSNLSDLTLSWQSIYAADDYELQVRSGIDFNASATTLYTAPGIASTSQTTTGNVFGAEGGYSWGIRATNPTSQSGFSYRALQIDMTNPNDVSLHQPVDASTSASDTVIFKWTAGTDPGIVKSPLSYILEVSTDNSFGTFDSHPATVDTFQLILSSNTYYWRVYALDEAGNQSAFYSPEYSIIVP